MKLMESVVTEKSLARSPSIKQPRIMVINVELLLTRSTTVRSNDLIELNMMNMLAFY